MIGDFVVVGDYMGSVEAIGVKSTRLRSIGGEQIVMSNADLLSSRLRNFESVYYVLSSDYGRHMEIKQAIYFELHEAFEREHIEFAYPTQKLWLSSSNAYVEQALLHALESTGRSGGRAASAGDA